MKKTNKLLSIIICLAMVMSLLPINLMTVSAADLTKEQLDVLYKYTPVDAGGNEVAVGSVDFAGYKVGIQPDFKTALNKETQTSFGSWTAGTPLPNPAPNGKYNGEPVISMGGAFVLWTSVKKLDLSLWDTRNVTNMASMFYFCPSLSSLNISGFNTSNVTDMNFMFYTCSALESLDLSGFNTNNVINMKNMFLGCSALESLDLSSWVIGATTVIEDMFDGTGKDITGGVGLAKDADTAAIFNNSSKTGIDTTKFKFEVPHTHCICGDEKCDGTATGHKIVTFEKLPADVGTISEDKNYYLAEDITLTNDIIVPYDKELNLDLNGHVLKGTGGSSVITIESIGRRLNICDCDNGTTPHYFTDDNGLWVYSETQTAETKTVKGGVITGGKATGNGGGIKIDDMSYVYIYGGNIVGNTAANGGGVYTNYGNLSMHGGNIVGNTAANGGGAYFANEVSFFAYGGNISDNTAAENGGGVYCAPEISAIIVKGAMTIKDNNAGTGASAKANNVYLCDNKKIDVIDALTADASIGITTKTAPTDGNPIMVVEGRDEHTDISGDLDKFFYDKGEDEGHFKLDADGAIYLFYGPDHTHSFTYATDGDTITATCDAEDCKLTDKKATASLTADNVPFGTAVAPSIGTIPGMTIEPTYTYKAEGANDFVSAAPTAIGTHTVKATFTIDSNPYELTTTFRITKAAYTGTEASVPTSNKVDVNSVELTPVTVSGEEIEYAMSATSTAPAEGWQDSTTFTGLTANTTYYFFARVKESENFEASAGSAGGTITTLPLKTPSADNFTFTAPTGDLTYNKTAKKATVTAKDSVTGMGGITVEYQKSGTTGWSATAPTEAGTYNVRINVTEGTTYAAESVTDEAWSFTINPKKISVLWKDTSAVYNGTAQNPGFEFVGLEDGDSVNAKLKEDAIDAGDYIAEAVLTGADSGNYVLDEQSAKGRFVIEKAPVTFTVPDSIFKYGEVPSLISVKPSPLVGCSISYIDKDGEYIDPYTAAPGTYDIVVTFDNSPINKNYRHADGADGGRRKIAALTIYQNPQIQKYTITYDANGGEGTVTDSVELYYGELRTLKNNTFTNGAKKFGGWEYNGKIYEEGEFFSQPEENVTFKAVWIDDSFSISGNVINDATPAEPVEKAVVTLKKGNDIIEIVTTSPTGGFNFNTAVIPGKYNLVVSKNMSTTTILVEVDGTDWDNNGNPIILPVGNLNAIVHVKSGTPAVLVGNLENNFTAADRETAATSNVELKLVAEATVKELSQKDAIVESDSNASLFLDLSLLKSVDGGAEQEISDAEDLLTIIIPLPADLQGKSRYTVYRYHDGDVQALTASPNADGEKIEVSSDKRSITIYTKKFSLYAIAGIMRANNPSVGGGVSAIQYPVNEAKAENGKIELSTKQAVKGVRVTITARPDEGYELDKLTVTDKNGKKLAITEEKNGKFSFVMPEGGVAVNATFKKAEEEKQPIEVKTPGSPFSDVNENDWFYDAVIEAYENGLMSGTGKTMFSPELTTTRGMIATVLYRMESEPVTNYAMTFKDVDADSWYTEAIRWAASNGIVKGYSEDVYAPNDDITREQLAAILYRYAVFKGYDVSVGEDTNILSYDDALNISEYAIPAIQWACGTGLMSGMGNNTLAPQGNATRAQVATMFIRLLNVK